MWRECGILVRNPIYLFCMILFPMLIMLFFTSLMSEGLPTELPCGVVDHDNTSTTREIARRLDGMQTSHVVGRYNSVSEARQAIQRGEIYAFMYFPKGTTADLLASRQPTISFYYSSVTLMTGALLMRDMKTTTMLASAAVGAAKLSAIGKSEGEIQAFLQPIVIDVHLPNNPWTNYNVYLTTMMVPGLFMLLFTLLTVYAIGTELKFNRSKVWIRLARGNIVVAMVGKLLPHALVFLTVTFTYQWYIYNHLGFPHAGSVWHILLLGLLMVGSCQGFGIFMFGIAPSLRMSMSVCSLWAVLGISLSGATYPIFAMHPILEAVSWLFPLRHYYMTYQLCVFNGYPLFDAWSNVMMLFAFAMMPILVLGRIRKAMMEYVYIP